MLLGECPPEGELCPQVSGGRGSAEVTPQLQHADTQQTSKTSKERSFLAKLSERRSRRHLNQIAPEVPRGLDILHATSAALIHALRDVLLDADFENAMKTLTSWIPVKDEDLLMKVARSEWRAHQKKREKWADGQMRWVRRRHVLQIRTSLGSEFWIGYGWCSQVSLRCFLSFFLSDCLLLYP